MIGMFDPDSVFRDMVGGGFFMVVTQIELTTVHGEDLQQTMKVAPYMDTITMWHHLVQGAPSPRVGL